jgi:BASS family bile acid:Na+ symporter
MVLMTRRCDSPRPALLVSIPHLIHEHFLWLLLASYAVAAVWPSFGLGIRNLSLGRLSLFHESMHVTLPTLMLGFLLLNAGLGVDVYDLRQMAGKPILWLTGLAANLAIPIVFIALISLAMGIWHNPDEVQNILVGLALVASMPIAGSSTAWSQNADGDLVLSLGLVVGSTLLSPFTTPLAMHAVGLLAEGEYAADLHELAAHGTGLFLSLCVIVPSLLGMLLRQLIGEARVQGLKPWLKLANALNLILLCYSNAAISLPQAIAHPDADFLVVILLITSGLCLITFGAGWTIGRLVGAGVAQRTALMFALGMNNNGTGLVLASLSLAGHPRVLLPIIFYNLVQQVVAGAVGSWSGTSRGRGRLPVGPRHSPSTHQHFPVSPDDLGASIGNAPA